MDAKDMITAGALVIDVRSQTEWDQGHLPTAHLVPERDVAARIADIQALAAGDKAKPIVLYCLSGGRSARAKAVLEKAGFTNVVNGGGYEGLRAK